MSPPALSACIVLHTRDEHGVDRVLWTKRSKKLGFLGGYHAFLGGGTEPQDAQLDARCGRDGRDPLWATAAREVFEEAGLLIVDGADQCAWRDASIEALRQATERDPDTLIAWLDEHGARLDASRFEAIGRWTTPAWAPKRFETEFFLLSIASDVASGLDGHVMRYSPELEQAQWVTLGESIAMHQRGAALLSAPTIALCRHLSALFEHKAAIAPLDERDASALARHEHIGQTWCVPLKSPTLPPATHTNCFVVGARDRFVVVDPGSDDPDELATLYEVIDERRAQGARLEAIVITHHHPDHVCGVPALRARYGDEIECWGHEANEGLCDPWIASLDRHLRDDERIELGGGEALVCVATPGHAPGHIALLHEPSHALLAGDLVASVGTIVVRPPRGDMAAYRASLKRARDLDTSALCPAHGWAIRDAHAKLTEYIEHREAREQQVLAALTAYPQGAEAMDLVPEIYAGLDEAIWPLAAMSVAAHLFDLAGRGVILGPDDRGRWRPTGDASSDA